MPKSYEQLCKKTKDPCQICLQTVTEKTGVKCHGACEAWAHFKCLNYTPGKINDIKAGLITVICPCPDCKTDVPKEYVTNGAYSCNNTQCPANNPPSCEQFSCQANEASRCMPPRCPPAGTLRLCSENSCRDHSSKALHSSREDPRMEGNTLKTYCGDNKRVNQREDCPSRQSPRSPTDSPDLTQDVMQQMCKTVGGLAEQLNFLLDNMEARKY